MGGDGGERHDVVENVAMPLDAEEPGGDFRCWFAKAKTSPRNF